MIRSPSNRFAGAMKRAWSSGHESGPGGDYLSTEGGEICTRRYCSSLERFTVEKQA